MKVRVPSASKLFVILIGVSQLAACVFPSPSITPSLPTQVATSTTTTAPTPIKAVTASASVAAIPTPAPVVTLAQPTATAAKISPTNVVMPATADALIEIDAKGIVYQHLDGDSPQRVQPLSGEEGNSQIAFNGDGSIWFFTAQGVSRIANRRITNFVDERSAMVAAFPWTGRQTVWPVAPDGTLWTVADDQLLGYNGKTWLNISLEGANADVIEHIAAGPNGLLAVSSRSGLSVYTPEKGWHVPPLPEDALRDLWFGNDLLVGLDGSLWIGLDFHGSGGLLHYVPDLQTWTVFDEENSALSQIGITGLTLDASGDLWIANDTSGVLARRRAKSDTWEYLTRKSPFPDTYGFGRVYFGLYDDLWLPTVGRCGENGDPCWQGLAHYADGKWKRYTIFDGLVSEHIFALAVDPEGVPWLVTDAGLQRFQP